MEIWNDVIIPLELELRKEYCSKERVPDTIIYSDNIVKYVYETIILLMGLKRKSATEVIKFFNKFSECNNRNVDEINEMYSYYSSL